MGRTLNPGARWSGSGRTTAAHHFASIAASDSRLIAQGGAANRRTAETEASIRAQMEAQGHDLEPFRDVHLTRLEILVMRLGGTCAGRRSQCKLCGAWVEIQVGNQFVHLGDAVKPDVTMQRTSRGIFPCGEVSPENWDAERGIVLQ